MKKILLLCAVFFTHYSFGQDPHFSQYLASPLTLNPALTGSFHGSYRITGNYRQQWWSVGSPFNTGSVSFEQKLLQNKIEENDRFAVGALLLLDESLGGGLKSTYLSMSTAYHKALDEQGKNRLGIGFQATYGNRRINPARLTFANQFTSGGFDTNLPSGEASLNNLKPFMDVNTGIAYSYQSEVNFFQINVSVFHLARPRQTTLNDNHSRIERRYSIQAGGYFKLGKTGNRIMLSGLFMEQSGATEVNFGGAFGYHLDDGKSTKHIYGGAFYRINDAWYPYLSYKTESWQLSLSYDVITSSLQEASPKNGSMEISFIYIGKKKK